MKLLGCHSSLDKRSGGRGVAETHLQMDIAPHDKRRHLVSVSRERGWGFAPPPVGVAVGGETDAGRAHTTLT